MFAKSPLDGYWEEGYHYYLELKGSKAVLRDYAKRITLETSVTYNKKALARGEKTVLRLGDTTLSRDAYGQPMTWIKGLYWEDGKLVMEYYYTILGDKTYTLEKVDHGPFDNIVIRDDEILPRLQGAWLEWNRRGDYGDEYGLRLHKNVLRYGNREHDIFKVRIHAISYRSNPEQIILTPEDLTLREFPGMTQITVEKDMLTAYMIVCDVSTPMSVFVRREQLDTVAVPAEALREARNLMIDPAIDVPPEPEPLPEPIGGSSVRILRQTRPEECGGTDATQDDSAPKTITSRQMLLFDVTSALPMGMGMPREKDPLGYLSAFAAPAAEGIFLFLQTGEAFQRRSEKSRRWAYVKKDIFPALVDLVNECDLAKNNGYHSTTHGLPENFGGRVSITYAGGEKISISDNQSPVLSHQTARRIADLFDEAMAGEQIPLPDVADLCEIRFVTEREDGGFTRATLTIHPDGTAVNAKSQRFDDPKVYDSEKPVDADTVAAILKTVADTGMPAWSGLPRNEYSLRGEEKSLTFVFADGQQITVPGDRLLPDQINRGFFNIELEMTTKH